MACSYTFGSLDASHPGMAQWMEIFSELFVVLYIGRSGMGHLGKELQKPDES